MSRRSTMRWGVALLVLGLLGGCTTLSPRERAQVGQIIEDGRATEVVCGEGCHIDSPLLALGSEAIAASAPVAGR